MREQLWHIDGKTYTLAEFREMIAKRKDIPDWLMNRWKARWAAEAAGGPQPPAGAA